ncbi:hypothetical protein NDU88_000339 [Pleurodeles waltl]|uniref:VWFC domain-containing protein n=1 Tax=Pleurodeles waltl TaxID=8319 RepID=A0AAV7NCF2_PLEWA|nr:hypothetical protein NDU88_000339 [Pleurodeles waltl]
MPKINGQSAAQLLHLNPQVARTEINETLNSKGANAGPWGTPPDDLGLRRDKGPSIPEPGLISWTSFGPCSRRTGWRSLCFAAFRPSWTRRACLQGGRILRKLVQALVVPCLCLWLATVLVPEVTSQECSEESCALQAFRCQEANQQCCKEYVGCPCEWNRYPGCGQLKNGLIPLGEIIYTDYCRRRCACKCNLELDCAFIPCPEIPPDCKNIVRPADGCPRCREP